jgi:hypothetical protein
MTAVSFVARGYFKALYVHTENAGTVIDVLRRAADVIEQRGMAGDIDRVTATAQFTEDDDHWWQAEIIYDGCHHVGTGCGHEVCAGGEVKTK